MTGSAVLSSTKTTRDGCNSAATERNFSRMILGRCRSPQKAITSSNRSDSGATLVSGRECVSMFFLDIVTLLKWNNEDMTGSWISPHHSCIGWGPRYDVIIHLNAKLPYPYQQFGINHCLHFEKGWSSKTNQITTVGWNLFILGENPTCQAKKTCWKRTIWYLLLTYWTLPHRRTCVGNQDFHCQLPSGRVGIHWRQKRMLYGHNWALQSLGLRGEPSFQSWASKPAPTETCNTVRKVSQKVLQFVGWKMLGAGGAGIDSFWGFKKTKALETSNYHHPKNKTMILM